MKSHATLTLGFLLLGIHEPVSADVYRCTLPDGRTVYQEFPCSAGQQKAIDDRKAQAALREQQRRQEEEIRLKEKRQQETQRRIEEELERRRLLAAESARREGERVKGAPSPDQASDPRVVFRAGARMESDDLAKLLDKHFPNAKYFPNQTIQVTFESKPYLIQTRKLNWIGSGPAIYEIVSVLPK